jgi:hypothetical protein
MIDYCLFWGTARHCSRPIAYTQCREHNGQKGQGAFEHCRRIRFGIATTVTTTMTEWSLGSEPCCGQDKTSVPAFLIEIGDHT